MLEPVRLLPCLLLALCLPLALHTQPLTFDEWRSKAIQDIRLRPRYGDAEKTDAQKASDAEFIAQVMATDSTPRAASDHLVALGFEYLKRGDHTLAMYRFNQAFLLEADNPAIYQGYGAFFRTLDNVSMAHTMYRAGLSIDSTHTGLLTDEATASLAEYDAVKGENPEAAQEALDHALRMLQRSLKHDPVNVNTLYRLAVTHLLLNDCPKAQQVYQQCLALGGQALDEGFERQLSESCP